VPDPVSPQQLGRQVIDACLAMGFALAGIAPAEPTAYREQYLAWLAAGKHGDMHYLAEMLEERMDIRTLLPGAKSVIIGADQYAARSGPNPNLHRNPNLSSSSPTGLIAKYARGRDYHSVIKKRLRSLCDRLRADHPREQFRIFVDTGPVLEREHAARAGLGFIGKHTLLINPKLGSYLLLGGVATTLDLLPPPSDLSPPASHCGTCTLCIDACPTQAITPYEVNATRCISYLTLEHRSDIAPEFHAPIADHLIGCDICQDICPFNRVHGTAADEHPRLNPAYPDESGLRARLPVLDILNWSESDHTRALGGTAAKRASLDMLKRNAAIVMANAARTPTAQLPPRTPASSHPRRTAP